MASRKKSTTPAPWFRDSVARQRELEAKALAARSDEAFEHWSEKAQQEVDRRGREKLYLAESIKLLRKYAHGFEAGSGFDLRDVANIRGPRLARLRKFAGIIRQELAQPHVTKVVRTPRERRAIQSHTGQRDIPGRFRYIVYTDHPKETEVHIVTPRKRKPAKKKKAKAAKRERRTIEFEDETPEIPEDEQDYTGPALRKPRVEVAMKLPGGITREEFFYCEDYLDEPPETFKDVKRALKKMLKDMPKGYYVLVTSNHGNIGVPAQRGNLLRMIDSDYMAYDKVPQGASSKDNRGLATVIVGFKLVSFTKEGADREYKERLTRRATLEAERRAQRRRQYESRRARVTGRR